MSFSEDEYYDEHDGGEEELDAMDAYFKRMAMIESPYLVALKKNIDEAKQRQENAKKANEYAKKQMQQQRELRQPTYILEKVKQKGREIKNFAWRGEVDVCEDEEDGFNDLVHAAVDNKSSNVLVRMRGNKLTAKQAEVKMLRIAEKPAK